jgi:hypothetical protein
MDGSLDVAGRSVVLLRELAPEETEPSEKTAQESSSSVEATASAEVDTPAEAPEPVVAG